MLHHLKEKAYCLCATDMRTGGEYYLQNNNHIKYGFSWERFSSEALFYDLDELHKQVELLKEHFDSEKSAFIKGLPDMIYLDRTNLKIKVFQFVEEIEVPVPVESGHIVDEYLEVMKVEEAFIVDMIEDGKTELQAKEIFNKEKDSLFSKLWDTYTDFKFSMKF